MKIAILKYATHNIGDDIQALAMERLLPRVDLRVDRDDLAPAAAWDDSVRLIVNGWFAKGMHKVWPPPGKARVLYVGFHATGDQALPLGITGPIGCRGHKQCVERAAQPAARVACAVETNPQHLHVTIEAPVAPQRRKRRGRLIELGDQAANSADGIVGYGRQAFWL